jgi:hypothetical protein
MRIGSYRGCSRLGQDGHPTREQFVDIAATTLLGNHANPFDRSAAFIPTGLDQPDEASACVVSETPPLRRIGKDRTNKSAVRRVQASPSHATVGIAPGALACFFERYES